MLERLFGLSAHGTNVRTELLAGVTTFLTMAYIVVVNPAILGEAGMPVAAVAAATCLAAGLGSVLMGLIANYRRGAGPGARHDGGRRDQGHRHSPHLVLPRGPTSRAGRIAFSPIFSLIRSTARDRLRSRPVSGMAAGGSRLNWAGPSEPVIAEKETPSRRAAVRRRERSPASRARATSKRARSVLSGWRTVRLACRVVKS